MVFNEILTGSTGFTGPCSVYDILNLFLCSIDMYVDNIYIDIYIYIYTYATYVSICIQLYSFYMNFFVFKGFYRFFNDFEGFVGVYTYVTECYYIQNRKCFKNK